MARRNPRNAQFGRPLVNDAMTCRHFDARQRRARWLAYEVKRQRRAQLRKPWAQLRAALVRATAQIRASWQMLTGHKGAVRSDFTEAH